MTMLRVTRDSLTVDGTRFLSRVAPMASRSALYGSTATTPGGNGC